MKNYKKLVPIALAFLMVIACFKMVSDAKAKENSYFSFVEQAEKKEKDGIYAEAFKLYKQAFDMYQTIELSDKIGQVVSAQGYKRDAVKWGKYVIDLYPTESNGYEYLMAEYIKEENFKSCFQVYDDAVKRQAVSEKMKEIRAGIEYEYELAFNFYEEVSVFANGYCAVKTEGKWGYADEEGELVIPQKYDAAGVFGTELAPVLEEGKEAYYIDKGGNKAMVLPKEWSTTLPGLYDDDIYAISKEDNAVYFNSKGEAVLKGYQEATTFNYNIAAVKEKDKWKFIKNDGKSLNDSWYEEIALDEKNIAFRNERAFAKTSEGYVMIDLDGKIVGSQKYTDARPFLDNTYAAVKIDTKWGFVDKDGKMVVEPTFEDAESFCNGFAKVKIHNLYGYIVESGEAAIQPVFDDVKPFLKNGRAFVKNNGQWTLLKLLRSNY